MSKNENQPTFVFVPGSWCPPSVFEPVEAELNMQGYETYSAETSAYLPDTNFNTDAREVLGQIRDNDFKNVVLVGWSRAFNIILRVAQKAEEEARYTGRLAINQLVALAGSSDVSTIPPFPNEINDKGEPDIRGRNSTEFRRLIWDAGDTMTVLFDEKHPKYVEFTEQEKLEHRLMVIDIMCADSDPDTQDELLNSMREHRRSSSEPALQAIPKMPKTYVRFMEDQIIEPDFVEKQLVPYVGARLIDFPGSHAAFLARPGMMADYLINIAEGKTGFPRVERLKAMEELPEPLSLEQLHELESIEDFFEQETSRKNEETYYRHDEAPARQIR